MSRRPKVEYVQISVLRQYRTSTHKGLRKAWLRYVRMMRELEREVLAPRLRRRRQHTEYHRRQKRRGRR